MRESGMPRRFEGRGGERRGCSSLPTRLNWRASKKRENEGARLVCKPDTEECPAYANENGTGSGLAKGRNSAASGGGQRRGPSISLFSLIDGPEASLDGFDLSGSPRLPRQTVAPECGSNSGSEALTLGLCWEQLHAGQYGCNCLRHAVFSASPSPPAVSSQTQTGSPDL